MGNSFQALGEGRALSPVQGGMQKQSNIGGGTPPWKQMGKGRGAPEHHSPHSKGKGKSRSPNRSGASGPSPEMEVDSSEAKPVELEALKKLIAATSSMLGGTSQEVLALQARLLQETPKRKEGTPVHVRLNQLEKRLLGIEKGMQKNEQAMDQAEEDLQQAASKVEEFRLLGKGLLHQQQELEEERASLIQGLQAGENFPVSVADPWVSKVSQMLSVVATHVDAGDEIAKGWPWLSKVLSQPGSPFASL